MPSCSCSRHKAVGQENGRRVLWGPWLPSLALPPGGWIIHQRNESSKGIKPWTRAVNVGLHDPSNNPAIDLIREKSPCNTKTKSTQLYKHWEGNSWSAEMKGAWENTSPAPDTPSRGEVPAARPACFYSPVQMTLFQLRQELFWSQQGDALGLQLADINSTGSAGVEEISQLGQVTCSPCSASEKKGLRFPDSAPAGDFSQVTADHLITGCSQELVLTPQLFPREHWLSSALCSAAEIYYRTGCTSGSDHLTVCCLLSPACAHFLCARLCGREAERARDKRQTRAEAFTEWDRAAIGGEEAATGTPRYQREDFWRCFLSCII